MRWSRHPTAEALRQQVVAAGSNLKKIQKALKVSGQFEQPQRVTERGGIDNNVVVLAALQQITKREQRRDLCHAGQRGIQQRGDLFAIEKCAVLDNFENAFAVAFKKLFEFAVAIDLPDGNFALQPANRCGPALSFASSMSASECAGSVDMRSVDWRGWRAARCSARAQETVGLPHTALPHDECQPGHRWVLPQRTQRTQRNLKGSC